MHGLKPYQTHIRNRTVALGDEVKNINAATLQPLSILFIKFQIIVGIVYQVFQEDLGQA